MYKHWSLFTWQPFSLSILLFCSKPWRLGINHTCMLVSGPGIALTMSEEGPVQLYALTAWGLIITKPCHRLLSHTLSSLNIHLCCVIVYVKSYLLIITSSGIMPTWFARYLLEWFHSCRNSPLALATRLCCIHVAGIHLCRSLYMEAIIFWQHPGCLANALITIFNSKSIAWPLNGWWLHYFHTLPTLP